eukprot:SAG31_NODE_402_length_16197_cov_5.262425_12_plen_81_part_00
METDAYDLETIPVEQQVPTAVILKNEAAAAPPSAQKINCTSTRYVASYREHLVLLEFFDSSVRCIFFYLYSDNTEICMTE